MKALFLLATILASALAIATVAVPTISFVVHPAESSDSNFVVHATNITQDDIPFVRMEVSFLEPGASKGSFYVRHFRSNAICSCDSECSFERRSLPAFETFSFEWDGRADDCSIAPPGRYKVQLVNACDAQGCLGSYRFGTGESFEVP